jgi:hypothetical protein
VSAINRLLVAAAEVPPPLPAINGWTSPLAQIASHLKKFIVDIADLDHLR